MDKNPLEIWLEQKFDEVEPKAFYREVFPAGELQKKGVYEQGKYNAIALCIGQKRKKGKGQKVFRFTMTDELGVVDELTARDDLFCLMSPLSYVGKSRKAENARMMYGMAFDLDHIRVKDGQPDGLIDLWVAHIERVQRLPKPTYIVSSGTGLHLYYLFERPVPLFKNVVEQLQKMKHELTWMLWHDFIVKIKDAKDIQYEGIFQGFRIPGTITKSGARARAFRTGKRVTLEYLNGFVEEPYRVTEFAYKSNLTRAEAKEKYPEWYAERIEQGKNGVLNPWAVNRSLYDWWKREIAKKAREGHRYYCVMMLAVYAMKCGIYDVKKNPNPVTREELEKDAFGMIEPLDALTEKEDNHFDEGDVLDALDAYDHGMLTFPRESVEYRAGFPIEKNKRNGLPQELHLEAARARKSILKKAGRMKGADGRPSEGMKVVGYYTNNQTSRKADCIRETGLSKPTVYKWAPDSWKSEKGRPKGSGTKKDIVQEYRRAYPDGRKVDCIRETGLSKMTVYKWWDEEKSNEND